MQKKLMVLACAFIAGFSLMRTATAQSESLNIVTTAVPFLRILPDARPGGMGDAGIAISPDANGGFWDLGKIAFATAPDAIGVTYTPWLADIAQDVYMISLAGYHKLDEDQAFNASIRYFNLGTIQFVDANGNPLGTGRPRGAQPVPRRRRPATRRSAVRGAGGRAERGQPGVSRLMGTSRCSQCAGRAQID